MDANWTNRHRSVLLGLTLLLGLALRVAGLYWGQAYSYFQQGDGIAAYSVAVDFGQGEARAQYIGQPNYNERSKLPGPLWAAFCFLGMRSGGSIYGVLWGTLLLNTALIYLTYLLARRTLDAQAGLWAALLTATLPWPVYYSAGVYNPNLMGFLGALLALALWQAATRDCSRAIAWVPVLLLAMPQVHMSGLMLIPAVLTILLLCPARLNVPWLLGGLLAGLALYIPYLRGELAAGWQNTHGIFSGKGRYSWDSLKALSIPAGLLVNWTPQWTRTLGEYKEMGRACCGSWGLLLLLNGVSVVMALLVVVSAVRRIRSALKGRLASPRQCFRQAPGVVFLALLVLVPLGFALLSGKPFHTRYCLVLLAPFLALMGAGAADWMERAPAAPAPKGRRVFLVSATISVCVNLWLVPAMYRYQGQQIENGPLFTPSWRKLELVYQSLKTQAGKEHAIRVDDSAYRADLLQGKAPAGPKWIRPYVEIREKETRMAAKASKPPMVFRLKPAGKETNSSAAYRGQGIELLAAPP